MITTARYKSHARENKGGIVPKSLSDAFGEKGALAQFFQRHFDPETGRLARLMDGQIGPASKFGRLFDPTNKNGVIATIEDKVTKLLEAKLMDLVKEFSLDEDGSAMCRLKTMIDTRFNGLREGLHIREAKAEEAERGHVKGFDFEEDLYQVLAEMGRHFGDETEFVRGTPGVQKCKTGDHLITLGEATQHMDGMAALAVRLGEIVSKAGTVKKSGDIIEATAKEVKEELERRAEEVLARLRLDAA